MEYVEKIAFFTSAIMKIIIEGLTARFGDPAMQITQHIINNYCISIYIFIQNSIREGKISMSLLYPLVDMSNSLHSLRSGRNITKLRWQSH